MYPTYHIRPGAALAVLAASLLTVDALAAQVPVAWTAPERAVVAADSFGFRMNGRQLGMQVVSLTRSDGGYRFEETSTMPQGDQTSVVLLSPDLAMRSVEQHGAMAGREMRIDVVYGADRATGSALTPASGDRPVEIDAALPPHAVDDNVLAALLPAIDWSAQTDVVLPVFHSGMGAVAEVRLRVTGTETVETPAGSFEAYRVETSGDATPLVFDVESTPPHRLVRIRITGTPLEIVRLN